MPKSPKSPKSIEGFTLIEVIVVMAIVALAVSAALLGFNQLAGRDLDNQATRIKSWMESLADRSVLEGGLYGYRVMGDQLQAVSWFDHQWFVVDHQGLLQLPQNFSLDYLEDQQPPGFISLEDLETMDQQDAEEEELQLGVPPRLVLLADEQIEPLMVFLPSGQPMTDGELILEKEGGESIWLSWSQEEGVNYADLSDR